MTDFKKRLKKAMEAKKIDTVPLANIIGYSSTALYNLQKVEDPNPSLDLLLKLCEALEVTPNWLLLGKEPIEQSNASEDAYDVYVDVLKQEYFASRTELEAARTIIESQKQTIEQLKAQLGFDSNLNPKNKGNNTPKKDNAALHISPKQGDTKKGNKKAQKCRTNVAQGIFTIGLSI